jgi:hypothetical protein
MMTEYIFEGHQEEQELLRLRMMAVSQHGLADQYIATGEATVSDIFLGTLS